MARLSESNIIERYEWFDDAKRKAREFEMNDLPFGIKSSFTTLNKERDNIRKMFMYEKSNLIKYINTSESFFDRYDNTYPSNDVAVIRIAMLIHLNIFSDSEWDEIKPNVIVFDFNYGLDELEKEMFEIGKRCRIGRCRLDNLKNALRMFIASSGSDKLCEVFYADMEHWHKRNVVNDNEYRIMKEYIKAIKNFIDAYDRKVASQTILSRWRNLVYILTGARLS